MKRSCLFLICLLTASLTAATDLPLDARLVGGRQTYIVRPGDTLTAIAAMHAVTPEAIATLNGLANPDRLKPGTVLQIDNPHLAVVDTRYAVTISIAQRMLFLAKGDAILAYPITVGRAGWPTPTGEFTIMTKEISPTWDVPASIQREMAAQGKPVITRMAPSPENPLGSRWIGTSLPSIGIHGTNAPSSIYRYASHGCIRMNPVHVEELFEQVTVGMKGVLTYEPIIFAVIDGHAWLEVHPDPYRRLGDPMARVRALAAAHGATGLVSWPAVEAALLRRDGRVQDVTLPRSPYLDASIPAR